MHACVESFSMASRQSRLPTSNSDRKNVTSVKAGKDALSKHLLKTKICSLFLNGRCFYGDKCFYAHNFSELRQQPELSKTSLCQNWRRGSCSAGDSCRYAHDHTEMHESAKGVMCLWHSNGHCSHGNKCRFAHSEKELSSHKQLLKKKQSPMLRQDSTDSNASTSPSSTSPSHYTIDLTDPWNQAFLDPGVGATGTEELDTSSILALISSLTLDRDSEDLLSMKSCTMDEYFDKEGISDIPPFYTPSQPRTRLSSEQLSPCGICGSRLGAGNCFCQVFCDTEQLLRLL